MLLWLHSFTCNKKKKMPIKEHLPAGVVWDEVATVLETVWTGKKQNTT